MTYQTTSFSSVTWQQMMQTIVTQTLIAAYHAFAKWVLNVCNPMLLQCYISCDYFFCSKLINVTDCDDTPENNIQHCQIRVVQNFVHVGQQTADISIRSYTDNLTIHSQMLIFHGVIAGELSESVLFRSTSKSQPNNIGGKMSVRTSVRPQKVSFIWMKFGI